MFKCCSQNALFIIGLIVICLFCERAESQQSSPVDIPTNEGNVSASTDADVALPASRIIELLRTKPELLIELKKVAADQLQARGIPVQEDSITDEALFQRITTDQNLRANITLWMRARGYLSDADILQSRTSALDSNEESSAEYGQLDRSLPRLPSESLDQVTMASGSRGDELAGIGATRDELVTSEAVPSRSTAIAPLPRGKSSMGRPERDPNASTTPEVLHSPTPFNLMSLRDLYTQVPDQTSSLRRFGSDAFLSRGMGSKNASFDLPVGPDYILGPGDSLNIDLWGSISQRFTRAVDREGRVSLPESGPVVVAGLTLEQAQRLIENALSSQFRSARVEVSVTRLKTVRIYVVGDVQRPGAYDVSSLSTPLNALYAAGGPTAVGSLRTVRHYRGKQLIREIDLYDFLLHGVRSDTERLEPGDSILVPPVGTQVTISGMVRRPAIYELRNETRLSEALELAGGVLVSGAMREIKVERIEAHENRITLSVHLPEGDDEAGVRASIQSFVVRDGDRVVVAPILPYSERTIYVEGHVIRPGKVAYRDNMGLTDVIQSYQNLLPEPADRAEIIRLRPPDYRPETIDFSLSEVLIGNDPIQLQPFDTIRIFGRYEVDAPRVGIEGEVARPGYYPLPEGLTAAQLVRMAGGFKRSALLESADLTSYDVVHGEKIVSRRSSLNIGRAVKDKDSAADALLKPGDILTIHQLSGWNDIGASVTVKGEVMYSGMYGIQDGEKLSSVLRRAGGFRPGAYPIGAVLLRTQVRELEQKSRTELIHQLETTSPAAKLSPAITGQDGIGALQLVMAQQKQVVQQLKSEPPTGRLVIKISSDISSWQNTAADIEMRAGDVITIPKKPGFVLVTGQVYNSAALTFVPGKNAGWYLRHAGGPTTIANKKEIFVIRANGSVIGRDSGGWYNDGVLETKMQPGDIVVVPQKIIGGNNVWKNMMATAQLMANIAITAHVAGF